MAIRNRFAELHDEIAGWRQDLHRHPELLFDTHRTSAFVAEKLREFGCDEVVGGIGRTGVVGIVHGRTRLSGRVVGLRADMDALPITETSGVSHASVEPGKMHACGHDGHTSMLLGATKYLAETRNFDGTAAVIFQPAEEGGGGGREMVEDGLMERFGVQEVYGMHNMPGLPAGEFAIRSGPFLAAADTVAIRVEGLGGHAARPHVAVDTTVVACHIVIALQTIASRHVDPLEPVVVSITSFRTGSETYNVIPGTVELMGTIRTMNEDVRIDVRKRIEEIASSTAAAFGARAFVEIEDGYPVMVNSETETQHAAKAAERVAGTVNRDAAKLMGAEDFSFMLNERPGAYILIGNGDTAPVHNSHYDFNDEAIPSGCSWWVEVAESRLSAD
ncbi:MAG: amidohydrolase [Rhodobacteraceae bacterium]|nr:amidohydrolase [Paracoccaceae bacterium]